MTQTDEAQVADTLNLVQRTAFRMADGWADGLGLEYNGVDLTAPMLYGLVTTFNQQLMSFYFPVKDVAQEPAGQPSAPAQAAETETQEAAHEPEPA